MGRQWKTILKRISFLQQKCKGLYNFFQNFHLANPAPQSKSFRALLVPPKYFFSPIQKGPSSSSSSFFFRRHVTSRKRKSRKKKTCLSTFFLGGGKELGGQKNLVCLLLCQYEEGRDSTLSADWIYERGERREKNSEEEKEENIFHQSIPPFFFILRGGSILGTERKGRDPTKLGWK